MSSFFSCLASPKESFSSLASPKEDLQLPHTHPTTHPPRPTGFQSRPVASIITNAPTIEGDGSVTVYRSVGWDPDYFSPFALLDHFTGVASFPPHPHRGIQTLTYMLDGNVHHQDSMGNRGVVGKGGAQLIVTGRGVVHSEMSHSMPVNGLQLWINLHKKHKFVRPEYQEAVGGGGGVGIVAVGADIKQQQQQHQQQQRRIIPTISCDDSDGQKNGITATLVLGNAFGLSSTLTAKTPVQYIHYTMGPNMVLDHPIPGHWNVFCYGVSGSGQVDGKIAKSGQTIFWKRGNGGGGGDNDDLALEMIAREAQRVHFGEDDNDNNQNDQNDDQHQQQQPHQTTRLSTASDGAPQALIIDQQDDIVKWVNGGDEDDDDDDYYDGMEMLIQNDDQQVVSLVDGHPDDQSDDADHRSTTFTATTTTNNNKTKTNLGQQPKSHHPIPTSFPPTYNPPHNTIINIDPTNNNTNKNNNQDTTTTATQTTPTPTPTPSSTPFPTSNNGVTIHSGPNGFSFILVSGEPIYNETIASAGPMLMSTDAEADEAWGDYYDEVNGFEGSKAWKRGWKP